MVPAALDHLGSSFEAVRIIPLRDNFCADTDMDYDTSFLPSIPSATPPPSLDAAPLPGSIRKRTYLPVEIILTILSFIPRCPASQPIFYMCCLVSRQWYAAAIPYLYHSPYLTGRNFNHFVATVCPSVNVHVRKSELAELVKRLDMSRLVHDGSKSLTARLLGRMKAGLEEFIAPQATFAWDLRTILCPDVKPLTPTVQSSVNCFAAISKCSSLRLLDLSLISEAIELSDLFRATKTLSKLHTLYFPRSSTYDRGFNPTSFAWPPNLRVLNLAGGVSDNFLLRADNIPSSLETLTIEHCPFAKAASIRTLLAKLAPQLTTCTISYHIPTLHYNALDRLLLICPRLHTLTVAVDYISARFFDDENCPKPSHPLVQLSLESSGNMGVAQKVSPNDIYIAVCEGGLANLRRVRVNERLGWMEKKDGKEDVRDLVDLLEGKEEEDWRRYEGKTGARDGCPDDEAEGDDQTLIRRACIPSHLKAGVWTFTSNDG